MRDDAEAEDRVQDAFLKAYANIDRYDPNRRWSSWLFKIAHNTCLDALRAKKSWEPLPDQDPSAAAQPLTLDDRDQLEPALSDLPPQARAVLHCKFALGLSGPEIAARLDLTPGNVRIVLHRAIKTLRARLA